MVSAVNMVNFLNIAIAVNMVSTVSKASAVNMDSDVNMAKAVNKDRAVRVAKALPQTHSHNLLTDVTTILRSSGSSAALRFVKGLFNNGRTMEKTLAYS